MTETLNTQTCVRCGRPSRRLWPGDLCDDCYYDDISDCNEAACLCKCCGADLSRESHDRDCENAPEDYVGDDPSDLGFDPYAGQYMDDEAIVQGIWGE